MALERVLRPLSFNPDLDVITLSRSGLFADPARAWKKAGDLVVGACDHLWKGDWRNYANLAAAKLGWFYPRGRHGSHGYGQKLHEKAGLPLLGNF